MEKARTRKQVEKTRRKRAEFALGKAQEIFRLLVEAVQDYAIFALDPDGNVVTWNIGAERLNGYTAQDIIGSHFSRFYTQEDILRQHPQAELKQATATGVYEEEGWRLRKNGERFWANVVITAMRDNNNQLIGFAKVTRDLTERKKTQETLRRAHDDLEIRVVERTAELQASEQRLRQFVEQSPFSVAMLDRNMHYLFVSQHWLREFHPSLNNKTSDEISGKSYYELFPDLSVHWKEIYKKCLSGETAKNDSELFTKPDGSLCWIRWEVKPWYDNKGKIGGILIFSENITHRKKMEEALKASEKQSRILADASSILSISLDYEKTLQSLADVIVAQLADWCTIALIESGKEPRIAAMAHPNPDRLKHVQTLFKDYPQDWNVHYGVAYVLRTGQSQFFKTVSKEFLKSIAKDERHFSLLESLEIKSAMSVPLIARGKTLGGITFISTKSHQPFEETDLILAEELGRRAGIAIDNVLLYSQAQQAIRIRDEFLSIASHELKTPLTSLKLQVQMRQRNLNKPDPQPLSIDKLQKMVRDDEKQLTRLNRLVDDMLDISRISLGKLHLSLEETDLSVLVREVVERFSPQLKGATISIAIDTEASIIGIWDRYRIEQILTNLLTNAMKYGSNLPIYITLSRNETHAKVLVQDQGIGIDKKDQARIFQRFERAVSATEVSGLGLGLYIVQQLIEAHHGRISVESILHQGSTFTVELPLVPPSLSEAK